MLVPQAPDVRELSEFESVAFVVTTVGSFTMDVHSCISMPSNVVFVVTTITQTGSDSGVIVCCIVVRQLAVSKITATARPHVGGNK